MSTIEECPSLKPRSSPPKNVYDLRPDDITVVGAIGDSITAGFAADGIQGDSLLNIKSIYEYRGVSYAGGGDPGAITVPNLLKKYSPKLLGPSIGEHLAELCFGPLCAPNQCMYSSNLPGVNYTHDWKLINIQIGSNDQCTYCIDPVFQSLGPKNYAKNIVAAIERIRTTVPRVMINLLSTFKVSQVYILTSQQEYCRPFKNINFKLNTFECMCAINPKNHAKIDKVSDEYNAELLNIFNTYKAKSTDTFGVMYTPVPVNITSFPIDALSTKGHEWVSKALWNTMFVPLANKPDVLNFDINEQVFCPTETDRIGS
ncbi:hypothetical protein CLU79DRAFT_698169 [Phycomyces nitens]|nr:hypothetical protein CLU79DRAFT_698169 [Phycomyces nitens]